MRSLKISVALCTYNGERFLAQQLSSIQQQTRLPDELIVCDDRSTDLTVSIVREFAATVSFPVKLIVNEQNLGYTANFVQAVSLCTGDLIALCDQDDIWFANRLERSQQEIASHPGAVLVFSDAALIDEQDRPIKRTLWGRVGFTRRSRQELAEASFVVLARQRFVTGATMMFRGTLRQHILPIPAGWVHDEWIVLIAAAYGELKPVDEPLIRYRIHASQQIGLRNKLKQRTRGKHWARLAESARELEELCDALLRMGDATRPVLKAYQQHLAFLRFRASLPALPARRLLPVLAHLSEYLVHASGWKSAVKDLVIPR